MVEETQSPWSRDLVAKKAEPQGFNAQLPPIPKIEPRVLVAVLALALLLIGAILAMNYLTKKTQGLTPPTPAGDANRDENKALPERPGAVSIYFTDAYSEQLKFLELSVSRISLTDSKGVETVVFEGSQKIPLQKDVVFKAASYNGIAPGTYSTLTVLFSKTATAYSSEKPNPRLVSLSTEGVSLQLEGARVNGNTLQVLVDLDLSLVKFADAQNFMLDEAFTARTTLAPSPAFEFIPSHPSIVKGLDGRIVKDFDAMESFGIAESTAVSGQRTQCIEECKNDCRLSFFPQCNASCMNSAKGACNGDAQCLVQKSSSDCKALCEDTITFEQCAANCGPAC